MTCSPACAGASASAQGLPAATPASVGVSGERLNRLSSTLQQYVDKGRTAGVVTIVVRQGKVVHLEAFGKRDIEAGAPMQKDTIFRIASMSKAITSLAAMILLEEGKLLLTDPVSKFIPSFAKTTVMVPPPAGAMAGTPVSVVPAKRPITIRDLLTHTAGIGYGAGPAEPLYKAANVHMWYFADKAEPIATTIDRLAALPFDAQPGERYVYGFNTDILGVVVEKASGMSLDEFLKTRIFHPLKMVDTHFYLPVEKRNRLAAVYSMVDGKLVRAPDEGMGQGAYVDGPRQSFSGGAGLLSTAADYARFLQSGGQRRRARRRARPRPEDRGADDIQSHRDAVQRRPHRVWSGLRGRGARWPIRRARIGGAAVVGRRVPHRLLGGSKRAGRGGPDGATAAQRRQRPARQVPGAGVSVDRQPAEMIDE